MITPYKGRTLDLEKPVKVYRNLTRGNYSIYQNGQVVAHAKRLCLVDCTFEINEKGRQRVIEYKKKNVHAFVVGKISKIDIATNAKAWYNPYFTKWFMVGHQAIFASPVVVLSPTGVYVG